MSEESENKTPVTPYSGRDRRESVRRANDWTNDMRVLVDLNTNAIKELRETMIENARATNNAIRLVYQIPLSAVAMYFAWMSRQASMINEYAYIGLVLVCLFPFFGDGIQKLIWVFKPGSDNAVRKAKLIFLLVAVILLLAGCVTANLKTPNEDIPKKYRSLDPVRLPVLDWMRDPTGDRGENPNVVSKTRD